MITWFESFDFKLKFTYKTGVLCQLWCSCERIRVYVRLWA